MLMALVVATAATQMMHGWQGKWQWRSYKQPHARNKPEAG
jgi:hypothetical protein